VLTSLKNAINTQRKQNTDLSKDSGENAGPERIYVHIIFPPRLALRILKGRKERLK
jgi:hypothetical protein